jgi:hypothetical protein
LVLVLPLVEWWIFRTEMQAYNFNNTWAVRCALALRYGGHEVLFSLGLFMVAGLSLPTGGLAFLRQSLVPLALVAGIRAVLFLPWWLSETPPSLLFTAVFAPIGADIALTGCLWWSIRRHLSREGRAAPGARTVLWPGVLFVGPLVASSWLRRELTVAPSGGPFPFDIWVIMGNPYPGVAEVGWIVCGAWITVLPVVLLTRWLHLTSKRAQDTPA